MSFPRADILGILVSVASFLPHITITSTTHTVTTITASCSFLLQTLAVVGSPLEQLLASLTLHSSPPHIPTPSQLQPSSPPPHTPTPSQQHHQSSSSLPPHTSTSAPLPAPHHHKWVEYIDLAHFGVLAPADQNGGDLIRIFQQFVSLPYPSWELLIKVIKI